MKLALILMLAFVTMSYQQQLQKQLYLVGENRNQQDPQTRIYNQPIVIRNNFNPNTEGLLRGLPQQGTFLVRDCKSNVCFNYYVGISTVCRLLLRIYYEFMVP